MKINKRLRSDELDEQPGKQFSKLPWIVGLVAAVLLLGIGGAAAAVQMEGNDDRVNLKGLRVGGVDLAGLSPEAAQQRLHEVYEAPLDEPLTVNLDGRYLQSTTRRALGASTDVEAVYQQALEFHHDIPFRQRLWYRLTGSSLGRNLEVTVSVDPQLIHEFVREVATQTNRAPKDASISMVGTTFRIADAADGFALNESAAFEALTEAAANGAASVDLEGSELTAGVTRDSFTDVIVVTIGENKLRHYRGERLVKTYDVATGLPRYPTPTGHFYITQMRYRPTWVNPAPGPGQWGANLPARIGPGPTNPLGTRAMNINSPNIRIHGTANEASLGYNASHGCIRMSRADVEELFELVGVGTPVFIREAGPPRPMPARPTTPTIEDLVESAGAAALDAPAQPAAPSQPPAPPAGSAAPPQQDEEEEDDDASQPDPAPVSRPAGDGQGLVPDFDFD